ncbi:17601_t:CDS:1, partial [Acaulospora morrowiae]
QQLAQQQLAEQEQQLAQQQLSEQQLAQQQLAEQQLAQQKLAEQHQTVELERFEQQQKEILEDIQGHQIDQMTPQQREKQAKEYNKINEQYQILEDIQKDQSNQSRDAPDLKNKVRDYEIENRNLKTKLQDLEKQSNYYIDNLIMQHNEEIQSLNDKYMHYYNSSNKYKNDCTNLWKQNEQYKRTNDGLFRELDNIKNVNEKLQKEAAEYQSKLGDARNYRLGDDDRNNSTRLTQDIDELQNNINTYARVKKGVELNMEMARRSLLEFGCSLEFPTSNDEIEDNKMLIKALLQRVVLKTIMDKMNEYLNGPINIDIDGAINIDIEPLREFDIFRKSLELIKSTADFTGSRVGKDEVSHVTPTKIRQQVFALLGDRGFSDIQSKNGIVEHPFITTIAKILDQQINKYRTFKNEEKKKEYDELAPNIIREVIKIFYFRCKVQEPEAEFEWIQKGERIDPTIMHGFWDDQIDQWSVDLCYFPLIGINLKNEKHRKVLYAARVLAVKEKEKKGFMKTTTAMFSKVTRAISSPFNEVKVVKSDDRGYQPDDGRYQSNDGGYQYDDGRYQSNDGRYQSNDGRYQSNDGRYQPDDGRYQSNDGRYQTHDNVHQFENKRYQSDDSRNQSDDRRIQSDDRRNQSDNRHTGAKNQDVPQVKHSNSKVVYDIINKGNPLSIVHSEKSSNYTKNFSTPERSNSIPSSPINSINSRKSSLDNTQIGRGQNDASYHNSDSLKKEPENCGTNNESKRHAREVKFSENDTNAGRFN